MIGNDLNTRSQSLYSKTPFNLRGEAGGSTTQVTQTALAWVRGQAPRANQSPVGTAAIAAAPRAAPAPITESTPTAGAVGSLNTALKNLELELVALRPEQTEQFMAVLGDPKATMPPELAGAHRALTQALETLNAASTRPDYDQVHRSLGEIKPPYALSNELLGLGLGSVQAFEAATSARSALVTASMSNPALKDIRYMDIKDSGGGNSTLHIQHTAADEGTLRAAVEQTLEGEGITAEVSYQRMGAAEPTLSPQQYVGALDHTAKARTAIMDARSGNAPLDDIAYMHIKEDGGKPPTLLIEHYSGDEQVLRREVDALLSAKGLDVKVEYRQLGPKPPVNPAQYEVLLDRAEQGMALLAPRPGALRAITYMHIKEGGGRPPTLRIESDRNDPQLQVEVLDLLRRNGLMGDVEFGLTGGR